MVGRRINGVIFDFDGTLVDTMPLHFKAYETVFQELGLSLSEEHFLECVGGTFRETIPRMIGNQDCPVSIDEIHGRKAAVLLRFAETAPLQTLPAAALLGAFAGILPLAIASSGSKRGIDTFLRRLGWEGYFDVVLTGEDVDHGKPSPEIFNLAAKRLGLVPTECLALEDTNDGVASALAAGMAVLDVRGLSARGLP